MVRREALSRYRSSTLGAFWAILTPLLMLAVYTFAFGEVFNARWQLPAGASISGGTGSRTQFAVILYAGLIVFTVFAETASRAPGLVIGNPNLVKKVLFPLELLPVVSLLSALFNAMIGVIVLGLFQLLAFGHVSPRIWLFPVILLPLSFICLGIGWFFSALSVYVRDIGQTVGIIVTGLMFLSPVFYPSTAIPERWRFLSAWNPLVFPIEAGRQVGVMGEWPDWPLFLQSLCSSLLIAWIGFAWFQKTRKGFGDVL